MATEVKTGDNTEVKTGDNTEVKPAENPEAEAEKVDNPEAKLADKKSDKESDKGSGCCKKKEKKGDDDDGCCKFLYNKETGAVLGRTCSSWGKITIFYIIFYAALAGFFCLMLYIFFLTLDIEKPKRTGSDSLIGTTPGVGFRPKPSETDNVDSTLVWFKQENYKYWSDQLKDYVNQAANPKGPAKPCNYGNAADKDKACEVKYEDKDMGPCTARNEFGYKDGEPCFLVKINRIYDWKPKGVGTDDKKFDKEKYKKNIEESNMPSWLKQTISETINKNEGNASAIADNVWISCSGENPVDVENIGGIDHLPLPAIPSYYFPFTKQKGYQSPYIMLHLRRVTPGVLVSVQCKVWATNIPQDKQTGSIHFEVMVE